MSQSTTWPMSKKTERVRDRAVGGVRAHERERGGEIKVLITREENKQTRRKDKKLSS